MTTRNAGCIVGTQLQNIDKPVQETYASADGQTAKGGTR